MSLIPSFFPKNYIFLFIYLFISLILLKYFHNPVCFQVLFFFLPCPKRMASSKYSQKTPTKLSKVAPKTYNVTRLCGLGFRVQGLEHGCEGGEERERERERERTTINGGRRRINKERKVDLCSFPVVTYFPSLPFPSFPSFVLPARNGRSLAMASFLPLEATPSFLVPFHL